MHVVEDEVRKAKTMDRDIVTHAMKQSFAKLNPKVMIKIRLCSLWRLDLSLRSFYRFFQVILVVYQDGLI